MEDRLREYIEHLFEHAPKTRKAYELQEEMIQNLTEKYRDLLAEGKSEEISYNIVANSIGDVSELFNDLEDASMNSAEVTRAQKKSALITSIAIAMYIVSILPVIIFEYLGINEVFGVVCLFLISAVATAMLIYNGATKPRQNRKDNTVVEDFREYQSDRSARKSLSGAIHGAMWCLLTATYFVVSFLTQAWYITWIIFLIGAAVSNIITLCFRLRKN